jgi:regulator of protease activity HflC (stomatin/prohibitin superfamily)
MFGIKFIKAEPTRYLFQYKANRIVREGAGLSFFYYAPTSSLIAVPVGSTDVPFIFTEVTADFQQVTVQGQVTYRVADPQKVTRLLNFTLAPTGKYAADDPVKLPVRVINVVNVLTRKELQGLNLREAIRASDAIVQNVRKELAQSAELASFGLEVLGLSVLAIRPTPETARALEAEAREGLLGEADKAIYARRNAAVEQERGIKENELNTEIAVENKKRQIRETQMDAERAIQEKQHQLEQAEMAADVALEEQKKELVALTVENSKAEADARAYAVAQSMQALANADAKVLQALASTNMKPDQLIAVAFQELAAKAEKIGQLNVSPDLLQALMRPQAVR